MFLVILSGPLTILGTRTEAERSQEGTGILRGRTGSYNFCISLLTFSRLLHLIGKGTRCNGTIFVTELSKQQYYAEDDNYRHDDAYGNQSARAATG